MCVRAWARMCVDEELVSVALAEVRSFIVNEAFILKQQCIHVYKCMCIIPYMW